MNILQEKKMDEETEGGGLGRGLWEAKKNKKKDPS